MITIANFKDFWAHSTIIFSETHHLSTAADNHATPREKFLSVFQRCIEYLPLFNDEDLSIMHRYVIPHISHNKRIELTTLARAKTSSIEAQNRCLVSLFTHSNSQDSLTSIFLTASDPAFERALSLLYQLPIDAFLPKPVDYTRTTTRVEWCATFFLEHFDETSVEDCLNYAVPLFEIFAFKGLTDIPSFIISLPKAKLFFLSRLVTSISSLVAHPLDFYTDTNASSLPILELFQWIIAQDESKLTLHFQSLLPILSLLPLHKWLHLFLETQSLSTAELEECAFAFKNLTTHLNTPKASYGDYFLYLLRLPKDSRVAAVTSVQKVVSSLLREFMHPFEPTYEDMLAGTLLAFPEESRAPLFRHILDIFRSINQASITSILDIVSHAKTAEEAGSYVNTIRILYTMFASKPELRAGFFIALSRLSLQTLNNTFIELTENLISAPCKDPLRRAHDIMNIPIGDSLEKRAISSHIMLVKKLPWLKKEPTLSKEDLTLISLLCPLTNSEEFKEKAANVQAIIALSKNYKHKSLLTVIFSPQELFSYGKQLASLTELPALKTFLQVTPNLYRSVWDRIKQAVHSDWTAEKPRIQSLLPVRESISFLLYSQDNALFSSCIDTFSSNALDSPKMIFQKLKHWQNNFQIELDFDSTGMRFAIPKLRSHFDRQFEGLSIPCDTLLHWLGNDHILFLEKFKAVVETLRKTLNPQYRTQYQRVRDLISCKEVLTRPLSIDSLTEVETILQNLQLKDDALLTQIQLAKEALNRRAAGNPLPSLASIQETLENYLTPAKQHFSETKTLLDGTFSATHLIEELLDIPASDRPATNATIQLSHIIKNIIQAKEDPTMLQELLSAFSVCRSGSLENLHLLYVQIMRNPDAITLKKGTMHDNIAQIHNWVWNGYYSWLGLQFQTVSPFYYAATEEDLSKSIAQLPHQSLYIKNALSRLFGYTPHHLEFDLSTPTLYPNLVKKSLKELVDLFAAHFPPKAFLEYLIKTSSTLSTISHAYESINTMLSQPPTEIWELIDDTQLILTEKGCALLSDHLGIIESTHT